LAQLLDQLPRSADHRETGLVSGLYLANLALGLHPLQSRQVALDRLVPWLRSPLDMLDGARPLAESLGERLAADSGFLS
jgi:hypothetical protein